MTRPELPEWADTLRTSYLSGQAALFVLHGNVRDLLPWNAGGTTTYVSLHEFLERFLGPSRELIVHYDVSKGLRLQDRAQESTFRRAVDATRGMRGEGPLGALPREIGPALTTIEDLVTAPGHPSAVIIDYFETLAPRADLAFMTTGDKANLVTLRRWSSDPAILSTDNLVILLCEQLSELSDQVLSSPQLVTLRVPFPEEPARQAFLERHLTGDVPTRLKVPDLTKITAGLTLVQIRSLLALARQTGEPVSYDSVAVHKKAIIEQECSGLVEFVRPKHGLDTVGGMEPVKAELNRVAKAVRDGRTQQVPMGMIFVGPMGTGKTFVAEAFAKDSGLTCLKFKNFRDRWVGSTEANLEKVLDLVEALGYVLLIIDEADRALAGGDSDGGTGSRVIARLKEFMSDTSHRGRVVMLMMTNRPDKLDTDLKRPGRFDLKIPFFPPSTAEERALILKALLRKNDLRLAKGASLDGVVDLTDGYSGAELESVLVTASGIAAADHRKLLRDVDLQAAAADVIPSRDVRMLRYMEMLAVFEASSQRLLPPAFRGMDTTQVLAELDRLRTQLGSRVR